MFDRLAVTRDGIKLPIQRMIVFDQSLNGVFVCRYSCNPTAQPTHSRPVPCAQFRVLMLGSIEGPSRPSSHRAHRPHARSPHPAARRPSIICVACSASTDIRPIPLRSLSHLDPAPPSRLFGCRGSATGMVFSPLPSAPRRRPRVECCHGMYVEANMASLYARFGSNCMRLGLVRMVLFRCACW